MTSFEDVRAAALALPEVTEELSDDGRPTYRVRKKMFLVHRSQRPDAVDAETGERLDDVLMFRVADEGVKEALLADPSGAYFTTPHFNGYPAILVRISELHRLSAIQCVSCSPGSQSRKARQNGRHGRRHRPCPERTEFWFG